MNTADALEEADEKPSRTPVNTDDIQGGIGSVALGKNADLIVIHGDPSSEISDIRNVQIVFKDGLGYDPKALLASVKGRYGLH